MARRRGTEAHIIEVIADDATVRERLRRPRKYSEADYAVHQFIRDQFEKIEEAHLVLHSANDPAEVNLEIALEYLQGVHEHG
jgi:predicted kinase